MGGLNGGTHDVGRRQCSIMAMPAKRFTCRPGVNSAS